MSQTLAPITISSTEPVNVPIGTGGIQAIVIDNLGGYTIQATMSGTGTSIWVQSQQGNILKAPSTLGFSGTLVLTPFGIQNNIANAPATEVTITLYGQGEQIPTGYPIPLGGGLVNIGNSVNTNVTATNAINNTTNTPGSNWLTVTPTDAASPTFSGDNSGNLTIKGDNAGVLTTLLQLIAGASPAVKLAAAAVLTEVLGNLKVDGTLESVGSFTADSGITSNGNVFANGNFSIGGGGLLYSTLASGTGLSVAAASSLDNGAITTDGAGNVTFSNNKSLNWKDTIGASHTVLSLDASNNPVIRTTSNNGQLNVEDGSGNTVAIFSTAQAGQIATSEGSLNVQKVYFNTGAIKDLNKGSFSASGTYNHGLTGTPTIVLLCPSLSGSTWTFSAYSFTSTQFSATINTAANTNWYAYR